MRRVQYFLLLLLGLLTSVGSAALVAEVAAQDAAPEPRAMKTAATLEAPATESVDVEIVNVEVFVTDDDGHTVGDLRSQDFRLFVDQEPTEIVNFYRAGVAASEALTAPETMVIPGSPAAQPAEPATLVIYVDHLQLSPGGRRSFLRQIREFLDARLLPGDQVMIVSHAGSLALEQRFSGDLAGIESVLDDMYQAPAGVNDYELRWRSAMDEIEAVIMSTPKTQDPCSARGGHIRKIGLDYAEWVNGQVERSLANLQRLVSVLSGFEGRKSLLYLSNGLHQMPGADMLLKLSDICTSRTYETLNGELATHIADRTFNLTRAANAANITMHTLDAAGLEGNSSAGVGASRLLDHYGQIYDLRETPVVDRLRRDSRQATLHTLALETGGLAILNANDIHRDLEQVDDSLRRFYSLGFRPPAAGAEGQSHLLRVELEPPRKGYRLHYRRTYEQSKPVDRTVGHLMSALLLGLEDNPLGIAIDVGEPQVGDTGLATVSLRIALPFATLGWLEQGDHRTGEVELFIAVQDGEGSEIDMRRKTIPLRIKESLWTEARARTHTLEIGLPVPSSRARLAFAVADRVGERVSYLTPHEAAPGSPASAGF